MTRVKVSPPERETAAAPDPVLEAVQAGVDAVQAERAAAVAYAVRFAREVNALADKGRIPAADAGQFIRRIDEFAAGLRAGLHREEAK